MRYTFLLLTAAVSLAAQTQTPQPPAPGNVAFPVGKDGSVKGVITQRTDDFIMLQTKNGQTAAVQIGAGTKVELDKSWFRHDKMGLNILNPGLCVEAKGIGTVSGTQLVANKVEFGEDELKNAQAAWGANAPIVAEQKKSQQQMAQMQTDLSQTQVQVAQTQSQLNQTQAQLAQAQRQLDSNTATIAANAAAAARILQVEARIARGELQIEQQQAKTAATLTKEIDALAGYVVKSTATIYFAPGSANLAQEARVKLDDFAAKARLEKDYRVEIKGYATESGNAAQNRRVGLQRARTVVTYLVKQGTLPREFVVTPTNYDASAEKTSGETGSGHAQNQRVELRLMVPRVSVTGF
jgi:outer membrane protein OmpA-like peptidoglycan-associated protein